MSNAAWIAVLIAILAGIGLGYWLAQLTQRKTSGGKSVTELRQEHEQFRDQVTDHFAETAQLVNQLTDSYKAVFDHLSTGAQQLADSDKLQQQLPPMDASAVSIQRVGYSPSDNSPEPANSAGALRPPQASQAQTAAAVDQEAAPMQPAQQTAGQSAKSSAQSVQQPGKDEQNAGSKSAASAASAEDKPAAANATGDKPGNGKPGAAQPNADKSPANKSSGSAHKPDQAARKAR